MLLKKFAKWENNKKGYQYLELRQGTDGTGKSIFVVQSKRKSATGKNVYSQESFKTKREAENWLKYAY